MSIFSRLFNKNGDGDEKDPANEEASPDVKQEGNSRKPPATATPATEVKAATMRPAAPSFDITPTSPGAPGPSIEGAAPPAPAARPARQVAASSRTLPYVTPDAAAAIDARVQAARAKAAASPARPAGQDPPAPPVRPRGAVPSPAAAPARPHVSKDAPKPPPPLPPEAPKQSQDVGKRKEVPVDASKGASYARPRQPVGAAATAAATARVEPVVADPNNDFLTLEFASSPRQRAAVPAVSMESGPRFDAAAAAVVPAGMFEPSGPTAAGAPLESEPTDSDGIGLLHDLDEAFGAMVGRRLTNRPVEAPAPHLGSVAEVRDLFMALAANHMRQVRDFMIGLKWGEAPREAVILCEAATQSLLRAAKEMELGDLCAGLESYAKTLRQMSSAEEAISNGSAHAALVSSYAKLAEQLPDVFALEGEQGQREAIIVHSLLQQVPDVRKVTIDKIYAAGLTGLDVLFSARPDEIAATTGISESLAALIVEKFKRYREDAKKLADVRHEAERKRLGELLGSLRDVHREYEHNASGWSDEAQARKKELRQTRNEAFLQIKVLLARLGEVGRLNELERLPFDRKIEELEKYL